MEREQIIQQIHEVWGIEAQSVSNLKNNVDPAALVAVVASLGNCRGRVITTGAGTSAAAAKKIAHSLSCVEIPSFFLSPADAVHGGLGVVQKGDVVIAVSKGGGTEEIIKILPSIKVKGATLIGVTENEESKLAKASDIVLKVKVEKEPCPFNMLATASTMAVIAAFDGIAITLMSYKGYTREQFAIIHPSGAVGERLLQGEGEGKKL
ncbi:MAG: SIS domain-containing protein [Bacillota bacterium]